jgi:hypothetical protein
VKPDIAFAARFPAPLSKIGFNPPIPRLYGNGATRRSDRLRRTIRNGSGAAWSQGEENELPYATLTETAPESSFARVHDRPQTLS